MKDKNEPIKKKKNEQWENIRKKGRVEKNVGSEKDGQRKIQKARERKRERNRDTEKIIIGSKKQGKRKSWCHFQ